MSQILIVDDDPDFVEFTRLLLSKEGFEVATASNSEEALRSLQSSKPDVILLDIMMSYVLEGLVFTRQLRSDPEWSTIPILLVSSLSATQGKDMFPVDERLTVEGWISKPVWPADLIGKINALLVESGPVS